MRFVPSVFALLVLPPLLSAGVGPVTASDSDAMDTNPVTPVERVDLERYAGLWYEVAKIPDGDLSEVEGVTRIVDADGNARLEVSAVSSLASRPSWDDTCVIGLDDDYQWSVVGAPGRESGWVLARAPTLDEATLEQVIAVLESNGYEWSAFGQVVLASCGQCQFGLEGGGCTLAVKIDGQAYYVDGSDIDDHGDAHASDGFCEAVREAEVTGTIVGGQFLATSFRLLPEAPEAPEASD